MGTVREILGSVRSYLGQPGFDRLDNGTILMHLYDQIDLQLTRLALTDENWIINRVEKDIGPGVDEVSLPPTFGRPFLVETVDDGSNLYIRREINIVDVQDWNLYWSGYTRGVGTEYLVHVAEVCAFFGNENSPLKTVKFAPQHNLTATYRIWYEIGKTANPALAAKPALMEQFHNLLKVGTALACLPNCRYEDSISQEFRQSLVMLLQQYDSVFDRYIHQNHHEDTGPRRSFNSSRQRGSTEW